MSLNSGVIVEGKYTGIATCDLCGTSEPVTVRADHAIKGTKAWREVPFKYRRWIACGDVCEKQLAVIRERELARDKEGGAEAWKIKRQRRPYPIEGTHEAVGAAPRPKGGAPTEDDA